MIKDTLTQTNVYVTAEVMPQHEGGFGYLENRLRSIIMDSIRGNYNGHFIVAFIVDTSGKVYGVRVDPIVETGLDIINIINLLKSLDWKPAMCNGKKVSMLFGRDINIDIAEN